MAFPTTSILDSFTGTGALGANWSNLDAYNFPFNRSGDAALVYQADSGEGGSYYNVQFGADQEVYATIAALPEDAGNSLGLEVRLANPTSERDGYHLDWAYSYDTFALYKVVNRVYTMMGASVDRTMTVGYEFGILVTGSSTTTVKAYTDEGSGWVERLSRDDSSSPITGDGYIAMHDWTFAVYDTGKLDDFGGGAISSGITIGLDTA
jgi:hypothetical protein